MIRFMADTWQDAVLRPIAMAAPNGWVYTEIMAPDLRFLFALGLALFLTIFMVTGKRKIEGRRPIWVLFALIFISFVPWMATTGNGRYFMPYIILIGPLCIGLIRLYPVTGSMKASITFIILGTQFFAVYQNNPWSPFDSWASTTWDKSSYLEIDFKSTALEPETTYVSVSNLSFSFAAPLFPDASRWINLSLFNGIDIANDSTIYKPIREMLANAKYLKLFQRAQPREMANETGTPNQKAIEAINLYLQPHRLKIIKSEDCKLLKSKSLISRRIKISGESEKKNEQFFDMSGFWICSLQYPTSNTLAVATAATDDEKKARIVFEKMELLCPRFFAPGQNIIGNHSAGYSRSYANSDSSLIITRDGNIYFTYVRALNPQNIGRVEDILKGNSSINCNNFKGRSGLPWDREI